MTTTPSGRARSTAGGHGFRAHAFGVPRNDGYRFFAPLTCSAMKRGSAKAATCTSGVQYLVLKLPAFR